MIPIVTVPKSLIKMFLQSGRSDFRVAVQNVQPNGDIDAYVTPVPFVTGFLPIHITITGEEIES